MKNFRVRGLGGSVFASNSPNCSLGGGKKVVVKKKKKKKKLLIKEVESHKMFHKMSGGFFLARNMPICSLKGGFDRSLGRLKQIGFSWYTATMGIFWIRFLFE